MAKLPEVVLQAWEQRNCPPTLTTVNADGVPNSVYVSNVKLLDDEHIAIADGAFNKTRENILHGSTGCLLFLTEQGAYQLKGHFDYHREGPVKDDATHWAKPVWPIQAVVVLNIESVYRGAVQLA